MLQCFSCVCAGFVSRIFEDFLDAFSLISKNCHSCCGVTSHVELMSVPALVCAVSTGDSHEAKFIPYLSVCFMYFSLPSSSNWLFVFCEHQKPFSEPLFILCSQCVTSICFSGHCRGLLVPFFLLHNIYTLELLCSAIVLTSKRSSQLLCSALEPVWCVFQGLIHGVLCSAGYI